MTLPQEEHIVAVVEEFLADLTSIFHKVNNVLPEDQNPLAIPIDMSVGQALALMEESNYSQMPIKAGETVLGVFSYRSFAQKISTLNGEKIDLNEMQVREFMESIEFIDILDDLVKTLDALDKKDVILVGNKKHLDGLLTPIDLVRYLYKLSSPFLLIGEIEKAIRNILRDTTTPDQLQQLMKQTLSQRYKEDNMPASLEEMTFNDYIQVIADGRSWKYFEAVFGSGEFHRKRTRTKLKTIGDLRNDTFHFKRELSENDISTLVIHRDWIENALTAYQEGKAAR